MEYRPKSHWYFLTIAAIAFLMAFKAELRDPALNRAYVAWSIFGAVTALVGAGLAFRRSRSEQRDHTN
jgi:hypothetical protein